MLTDKQKLFCKEYLVDLNATQAAIRAGYSADSASVIGSETLGKPYIQEEVQRLMEKRSKRTEITADRVLKELARIGFADHRNIISVDDGGNVIATPSSALSDDDAACISEISQTKDGIKIKLHDKLGALDKIGKHLKLFTEVADINHKYNIMGKIIAEPVGVQPPGQPTEAFTLTFDIGSDPHHVIKEEDNDDDDTD